MATCMPFARLAHYLSEFSKASHIFFKKWHLAHVSQCSKYLPNCLLNVGASTQDRFFYVQITNFYVLNGLAYTCQICKHSPNLPFTWISIFIILAKLHLRESQLQCNIGQKGIVSTCKKWKKFGKYLHS